ncbi:MAG: hypothetical protein V4760_01290 [Bdellovibrionota bacterium]
MTFLRITAFSVLLALSAPAHAESPIVSVTRVVGEVHEHFVTSREVRISDAIEQALDGKPATPEGFRILSGTEKTFPSEVGRVLDQWIVYLEAKSLSNEPVGKAEVARGVGLVQEKWGGAKAWTELEVGSDELKQMVELQLTARNFEKLKSDPQMTPVSDDDALTYYKKNRLRFGSLPFSSFKENIKSFLVKQQTERRLAEWHEILRRKYKVRNFISG